MISTQTRPSVSEEALALKQMQKINSWEIRTLDNKISNKVNTLISSMNMYNNIPLTPQMLETVLADGYTLQRTDCERHVNTKWEYVHVLSLLNQEKTHISYVELRCKPHINKNDNPVYIKSWNHELDIPNQSNIIEQLLVESPYVYLANKWNETARWSWIQSI